MVALVLLAWAVGQPAGTGVLQVVVDDWFPYSFQTNGVAKGTDVEAVEEMGRRLGLRFEFQFKPWLRALRCVREGEADAILSLYDTPSRREFLAYPGEPISSETIVLVAQAGKSQRPIRSFDDLSGLTIGVTPDTSYGPVFDGLSNFIREPCMTTDIKLKKLLGGRMALAVFNRASIRSRIFQDPSLASKLVEMPFVVNTQPLFIAFSKEAMAKSKLDLAGITRVLQDMKADGTLTRIARPYLGAP